MIELTIDVDQLKHLEKHLGPFFREKLGFPDLDDETTMVILFLLAGRASEHLVNEQELWGQREGTGRAVQSVMQDAADSVPCLCPTCQRKRAEDTKEGTEAARELLMRLRGGS